ncbi:MAG: glycosyltransferase family 4 protein [Alphaproteobacteria bacterium]|nr:glycosyltransferase family 4 protein [Alphaproteobacteria bacterium]
MPYTPHPAKRRAYVVGYDFKEDIRVFSGTTYHLAQQGVEDGLLTGMVNLYPRGGRYWSVFARGGLWKLSGRVGFKYTDWFLGPIWRRALPILRDSIVISNHQLFGSHFLEHHKAFGIEPYCYIDGTFSEYVNYYRLFDTAKFDDRRMHRVVAVEREGYASCRSIMVMSKRSAAYLARHYDVPHPKIHVVPPGANIPERLLEALDCRQERGRPTDKGSLVVGFIGVFPDRKGLPTIADAIRLLRVAGYDARLHVIGKCPPEIAQRDGIINFGLIDKRVDTDRFIDIVGSVDVGCMLSRAELAGIALLEFMRMGVPVIATDVGGIPDILELGAGELVSPEVSANDLAQSLARLIDEPDRLTALRQAAWHRRYNASWRRAVGELKGILRQ